MSHPTDDSASTAPTMLGPENSASPQPEPAPIEDVPTTPSASQVIRPGREGQLMRRAGVGLAALGTCLVAAPHVSSAAARALAPLAAPELVGSVGIAAGLLLFLGGLLRRSLAEIRGSLATVNAETAHLAELMHETQVLGSSVDCVQLANQELKLGVAGIQKQIERLTEIASDPNNTVSIFRLAASVDQLHARLDISIQNRLEGMRQQFTEMFTRSEKYGLELGARIGDLGQRVREELAAQQRALAEQLERTHAIAARAGAGVEANSKAAARIEAQIASGRESHEHALELISAEWTRGANALNSELGELGLRLESRIASQSGSVDERLDRIDGALESMSVDGLQRAARLNTGLEELGSELERRIQERSGSVEERLERIDDALEAASLEWTQRAALLNTGLEELGSEIVRRIQERSGSMDKRLERIDTALERSGKERDELARDHAARLDQGLAAHSTALQQSVDSVAEIARRVEELSGELNAVLAELGPFLAGQHEVLRVALAEGIEQVHTVSTQSGVAAEESLKAVARLESSLHDSREATTQALVLLREDLGNVAAQRNAEALELEAGLAQLAQALTDLAGDARPREQSSAPSEALELPRDWAPSEAEVERFEAPAIPDSPAEPHPEPPPALPTSLDYRSDVIS